MTERNRDGLIPGQQVDQQTILRTEKRRRLRAQEAGAASAAPVDLSQPWFSVRSQVESLTGVRPKNKEHARQLVEGDDGGTSEAASEA